MIFSIVKLKIFSIGIVYYNGVEFRNLGDEHFRLKMEKSALQLISSTLVYEDLLPGGTGDLFSPINDTDEIGHLDNGRIEIENSTEKKILSLENCVLIPFTKILLKKYTSSDFLQFCCALSRECSLEKFGNLIEIARSNPRLFIHKDIKKENSLLIFYKEEQINFFNSKKKLSDKQMVTEGEKDLQNIKKTKEEVIEGIESENCFNEDFSIQKFQNENSDSKESVTKGHSNLKLECKPFFSTFGQSQNFKTPDIETEEISASKDNKNSNEEEKNKNTRDNFVNNYLSKFFEEKKQRRKLRKSQKFIKRKSIAPKPQKEDFKIPKRKSVTKNKKQKNFRSRRSMSLRPKAHKHIVTDQRVLKTIKPKGKTSFTDISHLIMNFQNVEISPSAIPSQVNYDSKEERKVEGVAEKICFGKNSERFKPRELFTFEELDESLDIRMDKSGDLDSSLAVVKKVELTMDFWKKDILALKTPQKFN